MQSFLDVLKAAPRTPKSKVNTFLLSFNPRAKKVGIFLEGKNDPSFIRINVERLASHNKILTEVIVLGCKKDVLHAWKYINKRFPDNPRVLFFVDKDHDDLIGRQEGITTQGNLFVTRHYSIENYLVSKTAVKVILIDLWGLDSGVAETISTNFIDFQNAYRRIFLPWMAWHITARRLGNKPQIGNISTSVLVVDSDFQPRLIWESDMQTYLASKCKVPEAMCLQEIHTTEVELEDLPTKVWLRGKQEIWCIVKFLDELVRLVDESNEISYPSIKRNINVGNVLGLLAPRLPCPEDLKNFLHKNFQQIMDSNIA